MTLNISDKNNPFLMALQIQFKISVHLMIDMEESKIINPIKVPVVKMKMSDEFPTSIEKEGH